MTQTMDFESDQRLRLLTDALRAGPGSPEWRDAIAQFRGELHASGLEDQEFLLRVREHLASGKSYREIRAGAGFTRKVIEAVDREAEQRPGISPDANWIALISALVLVGVISIIAYFVWPKGSDGNVPAPGAKTLENTYFVNTAESVSFDDSIGPNWMTFGSLTLMADNGLRPVISQSSEQFRGGGIYWDRAIAADQPFAVEGSIAITKSTSAAIVQLFVTDQKDFAGKSATSPHELSLSLKNGELNLVMPDGRVAGQTLRLKDQKQTLDLRIAMDQENVVAEANHRRVFEGKHGLDAKPRTIGVRFVARGGFDSSDSPRVDSIRVMEPESVEK